MMYIPPKNSNGCTDCSADPMIVVESSWIFGCDSASCVSAQSSTSLAYTQYIINLLVSMHIQKSGAFYTCRTNNVTWHQPVQRQLIEQVRTNRNTLPSNVTNTDRLRARTSWLLSLGPGRIGLGFISALVFSFWNNRIRRGEPRMRNITDDEKTIPWKKVEGQLILILMVFSR